MERKDHIIVALQNQIQDLQNKLTGLYADAAMKLEEKDAEIKKLTDGQQEKTD